MRKIPNKKEKRKNKKPRKPLETKEELLYSCVDLHPKSLQEIVSDIKLPVQEVMAGLTVLEMKGYVEEPRKNHYVRQV